MLFRSVPAGGAVAAPQPSQRAPEPAADEWGAPVADDDWGEPAPKDDWAAKAKPAGKAAAWPVEDDPPEAAGDDGMVAVNEDQSWDEPAPKPGKGKGKPAKETPKRAAATGPKSEAPPAEDVPFSAAGKLIPQAIQAALALSKNWKAGAAVGWTEIQAALSGAWGLLEPNLITAAMPIGAVALTTAVLTLLMFWISSLAGIFSLVIPLVSLLGILAHSVTSLHLLGAKVGVDIPLDQAVKKVLGDLVPLLVSFLLAGLVSLVGFICIIVPGVALSAFMFPAYWAEGRRNLALNARSLDLFEKDGKRILLVGITIGAVNVVLNVIVGQVLGFIPFVGFYLSVLVGAAVTALFGAFGQALMLWMYFDIRTTHESGDAEAESRAQLE